MRDHYARPFQQILNRTRTPRNHWHMPERDHTGWIAVHARIAWQDDPMEIVEGLAKRWTRDAVWVTFADLRKHGGGVWLEPRDVCRRDRPIPLWWRRRLQLDAERKARRPRPKPLRSEDPDF